MKKLLFLLLTMLLTFSLTAYSNNISTDNKVESAPAQKPQPEKKAQNKMTTNNKQTKIKLTFNNQEIIVKMYDNPSSKDFMSLLPLNLTFEDYASTEKISYLPRKLSTKEAPSGSNPSTGDFTYFAPWGNLAIFYKDFGYAKNLIILGSIESGVEKLTEIQGNFSWLKKEVKYS